MSLFLPLRRATLLIPSGSADDPTRKHLFILLTNPFGPEKMVLLSSVSTVKPGVHHDPACLLNPGDHAFIKTQSFVAYNFSRIASAKLLQEKVASGAFAFLGMLDEQAFTKVREGLLKSRFVSPAHQQFFLESEI